MRIAHFGPLPPLRSGISDYCSALLPELGKLAEVDLWVDQDLKNISLPSSGRFGVINYVHSLEKLAGLREYDAILYHMGNNAEFHSNLYEVFLDHPGIVVLHDYVLHHFMVEYHLNRKHCRDSYIDEFRYNYGTPGQQMAETMFDAEGRINAQNNNLERYPLNKRIVDHATGIIAHSEYAIVRLLANTPTPRPLRKIAFLNQAVSSPRTPSEARVELGLDQDSFIVATFGAYGYHKRVPQIIEAFSLFRARHPKSVLLLVGWGYPENEIYEEVRRFGLDRNAVKTVGSAITDEKFEAYIAATDICLCLRFPTMGETSGTVMRAMALQRPVVVTDVGWYSELPSDIVLKIVPDHWEIEILAESLHELYSNSNFAATLASNARAFVLKHHDPARIAHEYVDFMDEVVSPLKNTQLRLANTLGDAIAALPCESEPILQQVTTRMAELVLLGEGQQASAPAQLENRAVPLRSVPPPAPRLPFGVNLSGYASSEKGVGEALRAQLRSLKAADVPFVVNEFVDSGSENVESGFHTSDQNPYGVNLIMVNADQVPHFAQNKDGYFQGHYNIGGWNWELSTFPREWCVSFGFFHEIWAPSDFVAQSLAPHSPIPIVTMPYSLNLDLDIGAEWTRPRFGLPQNAFVFLFFFDFHSLIERKNPLGLIQAFKKAFGNRKDVLLVIKCSHLRSPKVLDPKFAAQVKNSYWQLVEASKNANVKLLDAVLSRQGVIGLMSLSDCYVSLHRSEGFGLTMAEAMSLGKPVIATSYSGNMDFMKANNSFLVQHSLVEIQRDWGPYKKGNVWADSDLDHAAALMRHVYEDREAAAAVAEKGRQDVLSQLHPKVVGEMIHKHLLKAAYKAT